MFPDTIDTIKPPSQPIILGHRQCQRPFKITHQTRNRDRFTSCLSNRSSDPHAPAVVLGATLTFATTERATTAHKLPGSAVLTCDRSHRPVDCPTCRHPGRLEGRCRLRPLELDHPVERLRFILDDTRNVPNPTELTLISHHESKVIYPMIRGHPGRCRGNPSVGAPKTTAGVLHIRPTGRPKGVMMPYLPANYLNWCIRHPVVEAAGHRFTRPCSTRR